jgi:hypothetical protein
MVPQNRDQASGVIVTRRVSEGLRQLDAVRRPSLTRRVVMPEFPRLRVGLRCSPSLTHWVVMVIVTRRVSEGLRQLAPVRRPSLTHRVTMQSLAYASGSDGDRNPTR